MDLVVDYTVYVILLLRYEPCMCTCTDIRWVVVQTGMANIWLTRLAYGGGIHWIELVVSDRLRQILHALDNSQINKKRTQTY